MIRVSRTRRVRSRLVAGLLALAMVIGVAAAPPAEALPSPLPISYYYGPYTTTTDHVSNTYRFPAGFTEHVSAHCYPTRGFETDAWSATLGRWWWPSVDHTNQTDAYPDSFSVSKYSSIAQSLHFDTQDNGGCSVTISVTAPS